MKRSGWLILLVLAGPGCLNPPPTWNGPKPAPTETALPPPPPPAVLPEQVNDANAREMLKALQAELDYAENERTLVPKMPAPGGEIKP
jgi:hypothetical protein